MNREDRWVSWLRRRIAAQGPDRLGDDVAFLPLGGTEWAVSVDQQIEGVHYPEGLDARTAGRRLVSVCLSDLAAAGAVPAHGILAIAVPRGYPARRFLEGVLEASESYGMELGGGDTATVSGPPSASLTVFGRRPARGRWLGRDRARPGDHLWVGGTLGESALGRHLLASGARWERGRARLPDRPKVTAELARQGRTAIERHLAPCPQLELGQTLGRRSRVAAIDLSDGLAVDLHRLCAASGVGADVELATLPRAGGHGEWCRELGLRPDDLVISGGEDYVLLFTLPAGSRPAGPGCHRVGRITDRQSVRLRTAAGWRSLPAAGWDHLAD